MRLNLILKVPESLDVLDPAWQLENMDVLYEIHQYDAEWPRFISPGTIAVSGYKLITCTIDLNVSDPVALLSALFAVYELGWTICGCQSFDAVEPILDGEEITGYQAQSFMATDPAVLDYIEQQHTYDSEGNVTGDIPKHINQLHNWQGAAERK